MRTPRSRRAAEPATARAVHQFVPRLAAGDAVGNQVRYLRDLLRGWGHASEIYAEQWDAASADQVRPVRQLLHEARDADALLIHHSFESRLVPLLARVPGRKALVYHNVTPARLFAGFDRKIAQACEAARDELLALRPRVQAAWTYSRFSAEELVAAGYPRVSVVPFAVDWRAFDVAPDPVLAAELDDGCPNLLFVGRGVPSKRMDDVLRVFTAWQRLYQPRARLLVVGELNRDSPYGAYLYGLKEMLGAERVRLMGKLSAAQLSACFAAATAYLSMSRHEGFGVPLLEAMYRDVPVVAYGAAAVPETMDGAGWACLTDDAVEVARLLAVLERDPSSREEMLARQRARVQRLDQDSVARGVREALRAFLEEAAPAAPAWRPPPGVALVCPGFLARPDSPEADLTRRLARRLPDARVLTLDPQPRPTPLAPRAIQVEGLEVHAFTPDEPLPRDTDRQWPGSSSLGMALRTAPGPAVFLPAEARVAQDTLPHLGERAWGLVLPTRAGVSSEARGAWAAARLWAVEPTNLEPTLAQLTQALSTGVRHAS